MKIRKLEPERLLFSDRDLVRILVPLLIEQCLTNVVGLVDTMMISGLGEAAVSGVSLIDSVNILIILLFSALGAGGAIVAGQYLGQREERRARHAGNQLILLMAGLGVLVMLALYLMQNLILRYLFGSIEPAVEANARTYLTIVWLSVPAIAVFNGGAALLRAMGDTRSSMLCSLTMNVVNISGNALLLYGLKWGVEGAALPTALGRYVAAFLVVRKLLDRRKTLCLEWADLRHIDTKTIGRVLRLGIPNGLENSMFQFGKLIMVSVVAGFGTVSIAANAVCNGLGTFQLLPGMAGGLAITTVVSRCVGAGDFEQARYYTRRLVGAIYLMLIVFNTALFLCLDPVLRLYHLSPEGFAMARHAMLVHGIASMALWPLAFSIPNTLRAAGDVCFVMVVSTVSMWVLRVAGGYFIAVVLDWGMIGVWHAMNIDWCLRIACFVPRYLGTKWYTFRLKE